MRRKKINPRLEIEIWMKRKTIRPIDLARQIGVSPSAITHWKNGKMRSERIRQALLGRGCPKRLLDLV